MFVIAAGCSGGPTEPARIVLQLRSVEGQSLPVAFFTNSPPRTVIGGTLSGSAGGASCDYVVQIQSAPAIQGTAACSLEVGVPEVLVMNLGTVGGPSGNFSYRFE